MIEGLLPQIVLELIDYCFIIIYLITIFLFSFSPSLSCGKIISGTNLGGKLPAAKKGAAKLLRTKLYNKFLPLDLDGEFMLSFISRNIPLTTKYF
uniref:Uncharacterized protein n=1 Tax=Lepeophtheirus salmonis TaxID=72036 RepID=A0A0K2TZK1_LEPSM